MSSSPVPRWTGHGRFARNPDEFVFPEHGAATFAARAQRGFTLLEVVIVAGVIAILLSIALPSYEAQIRKGTRASAQAHLMDVAARQQQYLFDSRAYASDLATLSMTTPSDVAAAYTITFALVAGPPPSFTITATPKGKQTKDLGGAALTINSAGAKSPWGAW